MAEKINNICPIPNTHDRLNQAFSLFENILNDYQDNLRFTSALNNLIQNLRNVTFILQKELSGYPKFQKWYLQQQNEMKKNDTLRWLVDARNHVVKEGDLKKKSFATVRLKNNFDQNIFTMNFDPSISTQNIAEDFFKNASLKIPENLLEQTIIEVERIWVVDEYPNAEIIDVLIYCLSILTDLVYKAHEEVADKNALLCKQNVYINALDNFMVVLHNKIKRGRITRINYKTGDIYKTLTSVVMDRPDKNLLVQAEKKYGDIKKFSALLDSSGNNIPFNNLPYHLEMAKHLFANDGFLVPMAFLYFKDRPPIHIILELEDPATKYLIFEHLAEKVDETNCEAVVIIAEAWGGDMPTKNKDYIPAYKQQKNEFIWIVAATPQKTETYVIDIIKNIDGKSLLKEEKRLDDSECYMLSRIYDNWRLKDKISI